MNKEQLQYLFSSIANKLINRAKKPKELYAKSKIKPLKIFIIKQDEIGDMLYALHVIKTIDKLYAQSKLTVLCKPFNTILVKSISSKIKIIHTISDSDKKYDLVIDLRSNWKSMLIGIRKAKFRLDRATIRLRNKLEGAQKHEIYTNWDIIKPILPKNYPFEFPSFNLDEETLNSSNKKLSFQNKPYALFHVGARSENRRWPLPHFAKIIKYCMEIKGLQAVLIGGPSDSDLSIELSSLEKGILNLTNKTNLLELAALCRKASLFIGNESGPLHFANIEGTPLVALFGPGVPNVFYPYSCKSAIIHHLNTKNSITAISVQEVKDAIKQVL